MINYFKNFNSKTILMVSGSISIAFGTYHLVKYRNNLKQLVSFNQNFLNSDQEDRIIKKILHLSEEQNLLYSKLIKDLKNFHLEQNLNNNNNNNNSKHDLEIANNQIKNSTKLVKQQANKKIRIN
jgi:hypothetical protein